MPPARRHDPSMSPPTTASSDYGSDFTLPDPEHEHEHEHESDYGSDIDPPPDLLHLLDTPVYPILPALPDDAVPAPPAATAADVVKTRTILTRAGTLLIEYEYDATTIPAAAAAAAASPLPDAPLPPAPTLPVVATGQPESDPPDAPAPTTTTTTTLADPALDPRPPFDRFRKKRAQLSVTDLVSGLWCEQQLLYTLSRGFRRRTPAMKAGTAVHKKLEEQVHTSIPVSVTTKEDAFGLRLFNMSQGLRALEETGMTRELDVFGWLNGVFVNGVIDEVSYVHPQTGRRAAGGSVYVTDTKTRGRKTVPEGSQLRATALQLMVYQRLLTGLPEVAFQDVLKHYRLKGEEPLTDGFVAQVAGMDGGVRLGEMLRNNSLVGLWAGVVAQMRRCAPVVGDTVGVVFRTQSGGEVFARRAWGVDHVGLEKHLGSTVGWWRGERETRGVDVEDAWKCRMCEFQEGCTWRLARAEEWEKEVEIRRMDAERKKEAGASRRKSRSRSRSGETEKRSRSKQTDAEPRKSRAKKSDVDTDSDAAAAVEKPKKRRGRSKKTPESTDGETDMTTRAPKAKAKPAEAGVGGAVRKSRKKSAAGGGE